MKEGQTVQIPEQHRSLVRTVAATLAAIEAHYPHGIPGMKKPVARVEPERRTGALLFVRIWPSPAEVWRDAGGNLLQAAIEKGLGLSLDEVTLMALPTESGSAARIVETLRSRDSWRAVVLLGGAATEAGLIQEAGLNTPVIVTLDPATIGADAQRKRDFWAALKPLAQPLRAK